MIIPIRCFTCNKILASKWEKYNQLKEEKSKKKNIDITISNHNINNLDDNKDIFKKLDIERYCCKRCITTHIDLYFNI